MARIQRTIFVCTRTREAGSRKSCCGTRGADEVLEGFKIATGVHGMKRVFRATSSGCLDQCDRGVTVVVYPDDVWYGGVTRADVDEIVEQHVLGGLIVERLRVPDDQLTGISRDVRPLPPLRDNDTI